MTARLGYELSGPAGAPLLVLGGSLGTTRAMWRPQLPELTRRRRVLRFDHRGHGESEVPAGPYRLDELGADVLALLDEVGAERVSYAGLSLGGMIGMWLAAHAPGRIDRLALLCTSAYLPPAQAWLERARLVRAGGTAAVADAVVARWFTPEFAGHEPDTVAELTKGLAAVPAPGYAGCCEAIAAMDLRPVLHRIGAPTLVIAGAADPATPPAHSEAIAAAVPGARLTVVARAAHLASVERAAEVSRLLDAHFGD
ncbi:MAG TPA: 3-oxoadipate enol-lactonase [Planosporangium sp.]|jgi:3-oxoadipate enol-lactonase|nr:3-oxoadipate enol-lactonase [Planosporangium sp.]